MKTIKYILLFATVFFFACSKEDGPEPVIDPLTDLFKINEITEEDHILEIYSEKQQLGVGYNLFSIRLKDLRTNTYQPIRNLNWLPMMDMGAHSHSAPHSSLNDENSSFIYKGHIIFQMAGDEHHGWTLTFNYEFEGRTIEKTINISVSEPGDRKVKTQAYTGSDEKNYILAYISPKKPTVATHPMEAVLYEMEDAMTFKIVKDHLIKIDPRMPSMGNHSSPGNEDLRFDSHSQTYKGKVSFSMTGYWRINLQHLDGTGNLLKGEPVTEENPESSLYFEVEF